MADGGLARLDWVVLGGYGVLLLVSGLWLARRAPSGSREYFLAGRQMPVWDVAISVLATSLSAATFVGAPQQSFAGDLTYLSAILGGLLAIGIVAVFFVPSFYRHDAATVYELLEVRFGPGAKRAASAMFMLGRVFASGARVFIVGIPVSMIVFGVDQGGAGGQTDAGRMIGAIAILSFIGVVYTLAGGIRSVIWTDVIQCAVLVGAATAALVTLLGRIPVGPGELVDALAAAQTPAGNSKLTVLSLSTDPGRRFTLWTALLGFTLLNLGAYGTDHDLVQRMLTCRSAVRGSLSAVLGVLVGLPVTAIFMAIGLLLYVFYARPDLMGAAAPSYPAPPPEQVFLIYVVRELPAGLTGLMLAGLFAAGIGSLNSALNAMSATLISDFYKPARPGLSERHYLHAGRLGVVLWGVVLGAFACLCVWWYARLREQGETLIEFALSVMTFAYSGLVAVFLVALFSRRGTTASAIAALVTGFLVVLAFQPPAWGWVGAAAQVLGSASWPARPPAFPWQLVIATAASLVVCALPRGRGATAAWRTGRGVSPDGAGS
ncbi:MAG TPA: sodium:solute symporter [Phycisphaerales bacterium]|nr:sodium:solute symporter [Phycisphaerales bacterium]